VVMSTVLEAIMVPFRLWGNIIAEGGGGGGSWLNSNGGSGGSGGGGGGGRYSPGIGGNGGYMEIMGEYPPFILLVQVPIFGGEEVEEQEEREMMPYKTVIKRIPMDSVVSEEAFGDRCMLRGEEVEVDIQKQEREPVLLGKRIPEMVAVALIMEH
jgi:hypothetical protein